MDSNQNTANNNGVFNQTPSIQNNNMNNQMNQQPVYNQPQNNYQQPVQQQPMYNNNINNQINQQPVYNNQPQNNYQQPVQQQPMYNNNINEQKKGGKKGLLIFLAIVIIGLIGFGGYYFMNKGGIGNNSTEDLASIFDPNKPIIIKKSGKYGYIDSNGKILIEPTFTSAGDFFGEYAIVKTANPDKEAYNKEVYQIINRTGKVLLTSTSYSAPKYYSKYGIWVVDELLYNSKLELVLGDKIEVNYAEDGFLTYIDNENNESGIINYKGKKLFTWAGTSAYMYLSDTKYDTDDLYATVTSYSNPEREVVVSLKTGKILFISPDKENYYMFPEDDGIFYYYQKDNYKDKKYLYFHDGKLQYESTEQLDDMELYDYEKQILELDYGYNYDTLGKTQRRYYYDVKNKKVLTEAPEKSKSEKSDDIDIMLSTYGYKELSSSGKYGIMSGDKIIVPAEYDDIDFVNVSLFKYMKQKKNQELVLLEKDEKTLLMNIKNQKVLYTFDSRYVYDDDESTFLKATLYEEDGYTRKGYIIYNLLTGATINVGKDDDCYVYSNYITMKKDNKKMYYNTKLEKIYEEE